MSTQVGQIIEQDGKLYKVTAVDDQGKPTAADPYEKPEVPRPPSILDDIGMRSPGEEPLSLKNAGPELPAAGAMLGTGLGLPGMMAGAGIGSIARDTAYKAAGDPRAPESFGDLLLNATGNIAKEGVFGTAAKLGGEAAVRGGQYLTRKAAPLVQAALKPVWAGVQARAKITGEEVTKTAEELAQFIVDKRFATRAQADELLEALGVKISRAADEATAAGKSVDTATRIPRDVNTYLKEVEKGETPRPAREAMGAHMREILADSPLSRSTAAPYRPPAESAEAAMGSVLEEARTISPTSRFGRPPVPLQQKSGPGSSYPQSVRRRELTDDLTPTELLAMNRRPSAFDPTVPVPRRDAARVTEHARRDSFKEAVPIAKEWLAEQGLAKDASRVLDRQAWREGNKDVLQVPALAGLASGNARGAVIGWLAQALREGQLRGGINASIVGPALAKGRKGTELATQNMVRTLYRMLTGAGEEPQE